MKTGLELLIEPGRKKRDDPTDAAIREALETLPRGDDAWVTLSWGMCDYVTASRTGDGFAVEYEAGMRDAHYHIAGPPISVEEAVLIFQLYRVRKTSWFDGDQYEWQGVSIAEVDLRKAPPTTDGYYGTM